MNGEPLSKVSISSMSKETRPDVLLSPLVLKPRANSPVLFAMHLTTSPTVSGSWPVIGNNGVFKKITQDECASKTCDEGSDAFSD